MAIELQDQPPTPPPLPNANWPGAQDDTQPPAPKPYKRTGSTKSDLIKKYRQRTATSKKWRQEEGFDALWSRLIDLYRNKQFKGKSTEDRIAVNIAFSTVNTIAPSVAVNYPNITVNARQEEAQPQADAGQAAVNYWWRHHDWRQEVKRAVKDSLITGNGWVKVGWKYQTSARPLTTAEQEAALEEAKENASNQAAQDPASAPTAPTDEELQAGMPTQKWEVCLDEPFVERVSPFDILIDPEATCVDDLKWIAQRVVVPLEDVKADTRYGAAARAAVQADASTNVRWRDKANDKDSATTAYSDDVARCTLWEFYDMRSQFYCVYAENGGAFLVEPTDFPYPYGMPFVYLGNYDVPDQFYSMGDLEALEPLQHELNAVRSDMANHRRRWQRAYLVQRDGLDKAGENALLSNKDNRIIYVNENVDLEKVVVPLPQTSLDPQMYQYSEQIENDVDLITGVSEYQRGAQSEIRRTATEAAMIQDASNARAADKLAQIEVFMAEIARRVLQLAQVYLTGDDHSARILGPDGTQQWVKFDREAIQGEFDFEVEAGSTQPRDQTFRQQQALQLASTLAPYVTDGTVDPKALVTYLLREGFGIKNAEQFIVQQEAQSGPSDKLIETINYKDTPPDIQRQIESQAGLQPSTMGGMMPGAPAPGAGGAPSGDPGESQEPQGTEDPHDPADMPSMAAGADGPNLPPQLLAQLAGQTHLDLPDASGGS